MMTSQEVIDGYRDGLNPDSPEPSANRTFSYRFGFANGRDDRRKQPRASAREIREEGLQAAAADEQSEETRWGR